MNKKISAGIITVFLCFFCCFTAELFADDLQKYIISGIITDKSNETPIEGVEILITGDKEISEKSDVFGYYQIEEIEAGAYLEVTPSKEGFEFFPESLTISSLNSNRTINFTASAELSADADAQNGAGKAGSAPPVPVIISPSGKKTVRQDAYVLSSPPSGVSQVQPEYVSETKPFFAAGKEPENGNAGQDKPFFDLNGKVSYYASGLVGVRVIINDDRKLMTTTDVNGYYSFKDLKSGKNYTVKFIRDGYMFDPPEYEIIDGRQDFVINSEASVSTYKISGKVLEGRNAVEGVNVKIVSGKDSFNVYTDRDGFYEIDSLHYGKTYFVTALKDGTVITPQKVTVNKLDNDRTVNFNAVVQKFSISGAVKDFDGQPVKNAEIEFGTTFDTFKAVTDSKGKYNMENIPMALTYTIVAGKEGYESSQPFVIESLDRDREINFEIKNISKKDKPKKTEKMKFYDGETEGETFKKISKEKKISRKSRAVSARALAKKESEEKEKRKEAERLERKQREEEARQAELERERMAEQERLEEAKREEAERRLEAERERQEQKRLARQEREERERQREAERQEKLEKKRLSGQDKEDSPRRREAVRQEKSRTAKKYQDKTYKSARKKARAKEDEDIAGMPKERAVKEKTVKVRGKIESAGAPLKDITVNMSHGFSAKTDDKGRYELSVPAGKRYTLAPESQDFYFEPPKVVFEELKSNTIQDFAPYIFVEGEVFAEGQGIEDVQISLNGIRKTATSRFGKYKIEKIEYGSPVIISAYKNGINLYPSAIEIPKAVKNRDDANFQASFSITGKVNVQGGGMGAGNINIEVSGGTNTVVTTDFSGNFTVLGIVQGSSFEITPKAGGFSFTPPSRKYSQVRESFVGQNFSAVKQTYTVRGNVNIGGKPIKNAVVGISKRALKYYTDDEGMFIIANLDYGGPYTLTVLSKEHDFEPIVIDVLDKDTDIEFSTDISLGGKVMSGNNPVEGVIVDVNGKKHKTDANGQYLIKGLKYNGDYLLSLSAPGVLFSPSQKEYKGIKKSVLNEAVGAFAIINGRVTFDGKPFAGAMIKITGDSAVYKSDSNGYFLIKDLYLGNDYVLEISSPGYKFDPPKREYKKLSSGKMSENFKAFTDGMSVRGTVTADGKPLRRIPVVAEGKVKTQTMTNDRGEFVFENLEPDERYEFTVISKLHRFEVPSGIIEVLDSDKVIDFESGKTVYPKESSSETETSGGSAKKDKTYYRVSGRVTAAGSPLKGISLVDANGKNLAKTNAYGEYFVNFEAGKNIEVRAFARGYSFSPEKYSINSIKAASSNMNFTARSNTHSLSGHICNKDGKGIKGISVKDLNSAGDFMTDSKGAYKVTGLFNRTTSMIVPDSQNYNFYPENIEVSLESDTVANDIYAYPKKPRKAEAFVYGGINSVINISDGDVSVVMVSPSGGKVSVLIKNDKDTAVREFETDIAGAAASAVNWDGTWSTGEDADAGSYYAVLNGAGFKDENLKFTIVE